MCHLSVHWGVATVSDAFYHLQTLPDRTEKNVWLDTHVHWLSGVTWDKYRVGLSREQLHVRHARAVMEELTEQPSNHDWSKDSYYFFLAILHFDFDTSVKSLVGSAFKMEVKLHYSRERHHPEFEEHNPGAPLLDDNDVMEMAVDRMSRNLQMNGGSYNMQQMRGYEPRFHSNHERNVQLFREYVRDLAPTVKTWYERLLHSWKFNTKNVS